MRGWVLVVLLGGCGDGALVPDAATNDAIVCPGHTTFRGDVHQFSTTLPFEQWGRVEGVQVCDADRPDLPCATTDSNGTYELQCVPEGEVVISFTHPDYTRTMWLVLAPGTERTLSATLVTDAQNAEFFSPVNETFPRAGYGSVLLNETTHQAGIQFAAAGAAGPFYSRDGVTLDPSATGTVGDGVVAFIAPVGMLTIEITPVVANQICGHATGVFESTGHGLTIPVYEKSEADVYVACR